MGNPVGVMGLDQDLNEWYGQQPMKLGMGYRPCELLSPSIQVLHLECSKHSVLDHITFACSAALGAGARTLQGV